MTTQRNTSQKSAPFALETDFSLDASSVFGIVIHFWTSHFVLRGSKRPGNGGRDGIGIGFSMEVEPSRSAHLLSWVELPRLMCSGFVRSRLTWMMVLTCGVDGVCGVSPRSIYSMDSTESSDPILSRSLLPAAVGKVIRSKRNAPILGLNSVMRHDGPINMIDHEDIDRRLR